MFKSLSFTYIFFRTCGADLVIRRRIRNKTLTLTAAFSVLFGAFASGDDSEELPEFEPTPFSSAVSVVVGNLVPRLHYAPREVDEELSEKLFDQYFSSLDRGRRYFLAEDIEEFSQYRDRLHKTISSGDLSFPYEVYNLYLRRMSERVEFVEETLESPFDFHTDKELEVDRSDASWAKDREELDDLWRRQVKNRLINFKLSEEDCDEAEEGDGESKEDKKEGVAPETDDNEGKADEDEKPSADERSPEQRVLEYHQRRLRHAKDTDDIEILDTFLSAMARLYDPHTAYMAPAREEDFEIDMSLSLEGIGAVLSSNEHGYVTVEEIIPGGPADRDGQLQVGDRISGVSDNDEMVNVVNMSLRRVVRLIRGPKGSEVRLQVIPAGRGLGTAPMEFELIRDEVELKAQQAKSEFTELSAPEEKDFADLNKEEEAEVLPENGMPAEEAEPDAEGRDRYSLLTVTIPSFYADYTARREGREDYRRVSRDVEEILRKGLDNSENEIDGVVLDLRYNHGGSLEEAISIAGLFLPGGPKVQVRSSGNDVEVLDEDGDMLYDGPLVVLVNRFSASAAEIAAAAIQDYGRGIVVGDESTFGKGTVQNVYDLNRFFANQPFFEGEEAGSLKFTMAKYYRVDGGSVQKKGVTPDISLPALTDFMEVGEDEMDNALPWDEIDSLLADEDVAEQWNRHLPLLQQRSEKRVEESKDFEEIVKLGEQYREISQQDIQSLNIDIRREKMRLEDDLHNRVREETTRRRRYDQDDDEKAPSDPLLEEARRILGDLIWLSQRAESAVNN